MRVTSRERKCASQRTTPVLTAHITFEIDSKEHPNPNTHHQAPCPSKADGRAQAFSQSWLGVVYHISEGVLGNSPFLERSISRCLLCQAEAISTMSNKKTRRPSSSLYDRAAGTSRMELIREKAENEGAELIEDVELEATGDMNPKKVRWLSARASVGSWERWLWFSATVGLSVLCVILGVQLGKAMRNPPIYKETDLGTLHIERPAILRTFADNRRAW